MQNEKYKLGRLLIFQSVSMETNRKVNWTKVEENTLIEAIQTARAGDVLRDTGQSVDMIIKRRDHGTMLRRLTPSMKTTGM